MKRIKDEGGRERSGPAALVLSHIFHGDLIECCKRRHLFVLYISFLSLIIAELDIEQWGRVFLSEGPFSLWTVSMITLS